MQVFAVLSVSRPEDIARALARNFPHDHRQLREGEWLVAASEMTSRDVSDRLGISGGENGNAIVVAMDAYWGRAPNDIWEWVGNRKAAQNV